MTEEQIAEVVAPTIRLKPCMPFLNPSSIGLTGGVIVEGSETNLAQFLKTNDPFPITILVGGFDEFLSPKYKEFEAAGLLKSTLVGEQSGGLGSRVEVRRYELTDLGRSMYQMKEEKNYSGASEGKRALFCAGAGHVAEVLNFVIPAKGENTTTVTFRWNTIGQNGNVINSLPQNPWANLTSPDHDPRFLATNNLGDDSNSSLPQLEGQSTATLILTNKGWQIAE